MTMFFLLVILGATAKRAPMGFAGIPIGLALTPVHLISIPVTNKALTRGVPSTSFDKSLVTSANGPLL